MEPETTSALEEACAAVGGATRLAALLTERGHKTSKASISRWKKDGVPDRASAYIWDVTGISCERLSPDFPWDIVRRAATEQADKAGA